MKTILFELNGKKQGLEKWAKEYNLNYMTLRSRLKSGLSLEESLNKKCQSYEKAEISIGKVYNYVRIDKITKNGAEARVSCTCLFNTCGKIFETKLNSIRTGKTTSCGCFNVFRATKHGLYKHPFYHVWKGINDSCHADTDNNHIYEIYQFRKIEVEKEWRSEKFGGLPNYQGLKNFIKWLKNKAKEQNIPWEEVLYKRNGKSKFWTIDRINGDKGYNPENCRLATHKEQMINQRKKKTNFEFDNLILKYNQLLEENELLKKQLSNFIKS